MMQSYQRRGKAAPIKGANVNLAQVTGANNSGLAAGLGAVDGLDNFRKIKNKNSIMDLLKTSNAQNIQHNMGQLASLSADTTAGGSAAATNGITTLQNQNKNEMGAIDKMAAISGYGGTKGKGISATGLKNLNTAQGKMALLRNQYDNFVMPDSTDSNKYKNGTKSPNWNADLANANAKRGEIATKYKAAENGLPLLQAGAGVGGNTVSNAPDVLNFLRAKNKYLTSPVDLSGIKQPTAQTPLQKVTQQKAPTTPIQKVQQKVQQQQPGVPAVNPKVKARQEELTKLYEKTGDDTYLSEMASTLKLADAARKTFIASVKAGTPVKEALKLLPAPKKALPMPKAVQTPGGLKTPPKVPKIERLNTATNPVGKTVKTAIPKTKVGKMAAAKGIGKGLMKTVGPVATAYDIAEEYNNSGMTWFDANDAQKNQIRQAYPQFFDENGTPNKEFMDREQALLKNQNRSDDLSWKSPFKALSAIQSQIAVDADMGQTANMVSDFFGGEKVAETNMDRYMAHLKGISEGNPSDMYGKDITRGVRMAKNAVDNIARNNPVAVHPNESTNVNTNTPATNRIAVANAEKQDRQASAKRATMFNINQQKNKFPVGSPQWNALDAQAKSVQDSWNQKKGTSGEQVNNAVNNIERNAQRFSSVKDFESGSKSLAGYLDNVTGDKKYADLITPNLSENGKQVWRNIKDGRDVKTSPDGTMSISVGDSAITGSDPVTLTTDKKGVEGRADLAKQYAKILTSMTQNSQETKQYLDSLSPGQQFAYINLFKGDMPSFPKGYGNNTFTRSMGNDSIPMTYEWENRVKRAVK